MRRALCLAAALSCAGAAYAEPVVFYRCTDAQDNLTIQNAPCPKGMRQQKKVMQGVSSAALPSTLAAKPASSSPPSTKSAATPADASAPADTTAAVPPPLPMLPPPPLYTCTTREQQSYIGEVAEPPPRCVPLSTTDLDGGPNQAGGSACEVLRDQCQPLPTEQLCEAWKSYVAEAETHWRFAVPDHAEALHTEFERRQHLLEGSNCGAPDQPEPERTTSP
ncbi:DUF4124 domain-containing protein [Xanthomonas rydalmerensis]|uniref:DUF4124 domain-containing protein n=1 Tax=Xanthomonas rydalmerensis TaxID=3046274 RepID=A0ABZ0JNW5_9XANT|nr:DUF4124 domain-containing protein [Xanthomonas sp. DM-2023]WOS41502.1 DUF4124 domain-containing protein [Xanthomonas sp. DM-2023]WOS45687.1 DUF4124 domain-containing protein [Xanthomonas sp. DM-2023]WOS49867.1 DUF4124 domain-containing protein [Xanthomonas sp. DM-2023]WOS54046.1 DUF4124 domain-containing protein [Xanthomonas sp. DM-2023]WOS58229.1 DUF4124 domain-containing protein [Xanthomonas sp. DM-2023]